jgi:hypothetical protein
MTYARLEDNKIIEYPVYEGDIKLRFPNTSFAIPFEPPSDYVLVEDVIRPSIRWDQNIVDGAPQLIEGVWTRTWVVTDATPEQITERTQAKGKNVRADRNKRLADCDWTQLLDTPFTPEERSSWALYRETLRMVPEQAGFPWNVEWPPAPGTPAFQVVKPVSNNTP